MELAVRRCNNKLFRRARSASDARSRVAITNELRLGVKPQKTFDPVVYLPRGFRFSSAKKLNAYVDSGFCWRKLPPDAFVGDRHGAGISAAEAIRRRLLTAVQVDAIKDGSAWRA